MECTDRDWSNLSSDALLQFLTIVPPGKVPFPRLHTLRWSVQSPPNIRFLNMLLHGGLTTLVICTPYENMCGVFDVVARFAPHLEKLRIRVLGEKTRVPASIIHDLISAFQELNEIQVLELPPIFLTPEILKILSTKDRLSTLWTSQFRNNIDSLDKGTNSPLQKSFPSLLDLSLDVGSLLRDTNSSLVCQTLTMLHVDVRRATREEFGRCLSVIAEACLALQSLTLLLIQSPDADEESFVTLDGLREILKLTSLTVLEIDDKRLPDFDDKDMGILAPWCRRLNILNLCLFARGPATSKLPTLASLIPFAQHCPYLNNLGYFMDASGPLPPLPPGYTPPESLSLDISPYTPIENTAGVVAFLIEFLSPAGDIEINPQHCYLRLDGYAAFTFDDLSPYKKKWEEVGLLFSAFQPIREKLAKSYVASVSSASEPES